MSTSVRLIITLAAVVAVVMAAAAVIISRQQEDAVLARTRAELWAHARTLQIALDNDTRVGRTADAKQLIDRLSENPSIFGVLLFDEHGAILMRSDPLAGDEIGVSPEVERVIASGESAQAERVIAGWRVYSVVMPVDLGDGRRGAFEIAQRVAHMEADAARAQWYVGIVSVLLFATLCGAVVFVTRRTISQPIRALLAGAEELGRGNLEYRVDGSRGGSELARLASEFNRMADRLAEQLRQRDREAEERIVLERELRHTERLALVGRLAAGIAHELGAPLNVIGGRAEQFLTKSDLSLEMRRRNVTIIRSQVDRISRIVRQLLDLARPGAVRREPVDLGNALGATLELLEADLSRSSIHVSGDLESGVTIAGDRDMLQQVLLNVLLNAAQAMPSGGELRIALARAADFSEAVLTVADTGAGIASEHLPHVFEPFYTTKEAGQGTGLGLAVTRRIVEEHGGRITAESPPGSGALVTIRFPLTGCQERPGDSVSPEEEVHAERTAAHR